MNNQEARDRRENERFNLKQLWAKEWLNLDEAAAVFGYSRRTFEDWHTKGWLTKDTGWHKIGGGVRINQAEFRERFIDHPRNNRTRQDLSVRSVSNWAQEGAPVRFRLAAGKGEFALVNS
jgi:hypothetical protein